MSSVMVRISRIIGYVRLCVQVFQGLMRANKVYHDTRVTLTRLWIHECFRSVTVSFVTRVITRSCQWLQHMVSCNVHLSILLQCYQSFCFSSRVLPMLTTADFIVVFLFICKYYGQNDERLLFSAVVQETGFSVEYVHVLALHNCCQFILLQLLPIHSVVYRVFSDRLVNDKDMDSFVAVLTEKLGLLFDQTFHNICPGKQPPIFGWSPRHSMLQQNACLTTLLWRQNSSHSLR